MISVVVPAHQEEAVLARCLAALFADGSGDELDVVVVANGCRDRTVEIARGVPGVRVVELPSASKHAALIAGDAAARSFPRAYVDADVEVTGAALLRVADAMAASGALAGAPAKQLVLDGCPWFVRSFYRVWLRLEWNVDAPVGSGVYVLSAAGHARAAPFPPLINDDQWVHDLFAPSERLCAGDTRFLVRPPRTLEGLVARRVRTLEGQREFSERFGRLSGAAAGPGVAVLARERPLDVALFAVVKLLALTALRRKRRSGRCSWERDESSRAPAPAAR